MKRKSLNNVSMSQPSNHAVKKDLTRLAKVRGNSSFITKKNVLLGLMASTMVAVPVAVGITQIERNIASYKFEGKSFSSVDSAFDYVQKNSEVKSYQKEGMGSKWTVTMNGVKRSFDTPEALREYLFSNQIKSEKYNTSLNLDNYVDKSTGILGLDDSLWASMNSGASSAASKQTVYEKSNGGFTTDSDEAMKSYFSVQDAYYFNNMYFNSKETLRNYLISDYLPNTRGTFNSITIEGPNGVKSNPISLSDTSENGAIKEIKNFIDANAEKVVTYTNSNTQEQININRKNINDVIGDIRVEDLDYQHVQSNQGESRYIIDNSIEDEHNLIGPYFYKGNMDVGSFSNKNMWKKVNGVSKQVYQESTIDKLVGNFFTLIINDDNQVNKQETQTNETKPHIFRTVLVTTDNQSLDEWYLEQIKAYNVDLYNEIVTTLNSLMNGKKSNTFYKLPVMYSFIMQRLINMNATNEMIALTIGYFSKVADFIQDSLELSILDESLLIRSKDNKKFNVKEFFGIGNSEFDLNTSTEYFLNEIKSYDYLIAAISAYIGATNNINTLAGALAFSGYEQDYLFDFGIISKDKFWDNYNKFENIFVTFSSTNYTELLKHYIKRSTNPDIHALESQLDTSTSKDLDTSLGKLKTKNGNNVQELIKGVAAKNTYLFALAEEALIAEIEEYVKTGKWDPNGMLVQLGDIGAKGIVELYENSKQDENFSIYKSYIYILADFRTGSGVFNTHSSISNRQFYEANIAKLTLLSFATAGGTAYVMKKMYEVSGTIHGLVDNFYGPDGIPAKIRSVYDSVKESIKNRWTAVKHRIPFRFRTWHLYYDEVPTLFKKWSTVGIFKSIGKVGDLFAKAAPFLGLAAVGLELFMLIYDLLKVTYIQDFYVYTTADGTEFIWDGGLTTSRYFGMEVKQEVGINSMKLLPPIQVTKPQISEFYYYNQIKYFDVSQLKKDQLLKIASDDNIQLNANFTRNYTFNKDIGSSSGTYDTKEKLIDAVIADMGITVNDKTYNFSNLNKNSNYIGNTSYVLSNGIASNTGGDQSVIANNIVKNIRPTKVAQLPKITNGKISGKSDETFVLPGKVWSSNGVVDNSAKLQNYVVDNSANELANGSTNNIPTDGNITSDLFKIQDATQASNLSKENLFNLFKTKATPNSKVVLKSDALQNNEFAKLSSEIQDREIFKATLPDHGTVYFTERSSAENWVLKNVNFEKYTDVVTDASYVYNGMYFGSTSELRNWLQSVIVMG